MIFKYFVKLILVLVVLTIPLCGWTPHSTPTLIILKAMLSTVSFWIGNIPPTFSESISFIPIDLEISMEHNASIEQTYISFSFLLGFDACDFCRNDTCQDCSCSSYEGSESDITNRLG
jgi:hypothetical protein